MCGGDLKSRVSRRDMERVTWPGPDHAVPRTYIGRFSLLPLSLPLQYVIIYIFLGSVYYAIVSSLKISLSGLGETALPGASQFLEIARTHPRACLSSVD